MGGRGIGREMQRQCVREQFLETHRQGECANPMDPKPQNKASQKKQNSMNSCACASTSTEKIMIHQTSTHATIRDSHLARTALQKCTGETFPNNSPASINILARHPNRPHATAWLQKRVRGENSTNARLRQPSFAAAFAANPRKKHGFCGGQEVGGALVRILAGPNIELDSLLCGM